ncbi:MAG: glycosyltransferase [Chloroflexi bacterium]|nr:glycosyltransferase [Chloroflexota bacterium]
MTTAVDRVGTAEILVGIPSYRNARTIGHVVRTVVRGLRTSFSHMRAVVVNADGGSDDGTPDAAREALDGMPAVVGAYRGLPGKGSAFRAIFEAAAELDVTACAVVDGDLRSITPQWIERLLGPICSGHAEYVTPLYARHKHDGTITNTIAYPLTRALYGWRVRQPIGGEFGFSGKLARAFLEGGAFVHRARRPRRRPPGAQTEARSDEVEHLGRASGSPASEVGTSDEVEHPSASEGAPRASVGIWDTDVARFGIDIYMTTTALVRGATVAQAYLGAKVHDPKDPGVDLGPMFRQVVGTAFRLAAANEDRWRAVDGSKAPPVVGEVGVVEPEAVNADAALLVRRFREGEGEHGPTWRQALSERSLGAIRRALAEDVPHALAGDVWAGIVYDLLAASAQRPERTDAYVLSLVPLYFGRVAAFIDDARDMTTSASERLVEEQAAAFEAAKPSLRERWRIHSSRQSASGRCL